MADNLSGYICSECHRLIDSGDGHCPCSSPQPSDEPHPKLIRVHGRGKTEEDADRDARAKLTAAQIRAVISRDVRTPAATWTTVEPDRVQETVRCLASGGCEIVEAKELPARRLRRRFWARSLEEAAALASAETSRGIPDGRKSSVLHCGFRVGAIRRLPVEGGALGRFILRLWGRRRYEADLEKDARVVVFYKRPVEVDLHCEDEA